MRIPVLSDMLFGKPKEQDENVYIPAPVPELGDIAQSFGSPEFQEPHYRHAELILVVDSMESLLKFIQIAGFSTRFMNAAEMFVRNYYDRNILFSNLTGKKTDARSSSDEKVQIAYYNLKIDFMGLYCSAWPSDRKNPNFVVLMNAVHTQMKLRFTRTKDTDRERITNGRIQINYQAKQEIQQPERRNQE